MYIYQNQFSKLSMSLYIEKQKKCNVQDHIYQVDTFGEKLEIELFDFALLITINKSE